MNALLVESFPLLRIAMLKLLKGIAGIDHVLAIDPIVDPAPAHAGGDVDLIVFGMPGNLDTGWQWLGMTRKVWSAPRLLLLSDVVPLELPLGGITAGFCGCLSKSAPIDVLESAIRRVAGGHSSHAHASQLPLFPALPASPALPALASQPTAGAKRPGEEATMLGLTQRQYDVLVLLARGHALKTVGRLLNMSVHTVKTHARTIYRQLEAGGKEEAVYKARERGLRLAWGADGRVAPLALAGGKAPTMRQEDLI
jgi:DNA-binding NarL/FixJ family response regulator